MDDHSDDQYWAANHSNQPQEVYDGFSDKSQPLDAPSFEQINDFYFSNMYPEAPPGYGGPIGTMQQQTSFNQIPSIFTPTLMSASYDDPGATGTGLGVNITEFDEPPLLEELEIYPKRILQKSLAVLNPLRSSGTLATTPEYLFKETDLAGPVTFCLTLAACLSISDSRAQFGYIYGLSALSVVVMFCLIWLMCNSLETHVTISAVASVLGYSMLPIVGLSMVGVFVILNNFYGMVFASAAIFLATKSSSRMFCLITGDPHQRYLIAYPCALLYALFSLLVLF